MDIIAVLAMCASSFVGICIGLFFVRRGELMGITPIVVTGAAIFVLIGVSLFI